MLHIIRKNQQFLMTIVVIVVIVCFVWLYNRTNLSQIGSNDVLSMYGRVVQRAEIDRQASGYRLALALGLTDFVRDLGGLGDNEETAISDYIINLLIVQHQAQELGVQPSDDAVLEAIKSLAPLQTDGAFDPAKYSSFVQDQLSPRGLTERQLEEIVRDSLRVQALQHIITSPVAIGEGEIRYASRIYQPVTAQVIHFDLENFMKDVSVTPEEVSAFYEQNRQMMRAGETRSVSYVVFKLPESDQKLAGKDRANALEKLADKVVAAGKSIRDGIAQGLDFSTVAGKQALHPLKVDSLERDGSQKGKDAGLPDTVVTGAFRLRKTGDVSDVIQDGNSFYIVSVEGISPSRQLELADVQEKITTRLKSEKASKAAAAAATKTLAQIQSALKAGKTFADAVKAAGVKVEPLTDITPADPKNTEEQQSLAQATLSLKDGELGPLQAAPWGAFSIYLEKRTPLTDAQWKEHEPEISKKLLSRDQDLLFEEWLRESRGTALIKMLAGAGARRGS
jgi:hypothetical protein